MDGLSSIFNAIKPIASVALPAAGLVGNLLGQQKQNAYTSNQTAYQQYLQSLAKNPAQLSSMVNQATLPLSGALVQGVNNQVQGDLASRGLSQAPGIFASTEEQALAPYLLSQQDQARQQVLQSLGLGQGQQPGAQFPQPQNMTLALQQALGTLTKQQGGTQAQPQQLPSQLPQQQAGLTVPQGSVPGYTFPPAPIFPPSGGGGDQSASYPQATDPFSGSM